MIPRSYVVAAASLALLACGGGDKTTGPNNTGASGSVSFSFSGGTSGNFNASGAINSTTSADFSRAWAAGVKDASAGTVEIAATTPKAGSTHDLVTMIIPRTTTGSSTIVSSCSGQNCAAIAVLFGSQINGSGFSFICDVESGTITIASISNTKVTGSFSGTGHCFTSAGAQSNFTVTNGSFDVPLVTGVPTT